MTTPHTYLQKISFGDCDPAGIVFYPNAFRWTDATFHDFLRGFGGHAEICEKVGAIGLGLIDASVQFRSPMRDGDELAIRLIAREWGRKTLTMRYEALVGERLAFSLAEIRGLFKETPKGITAGEMATLKAILGD